MSQEETYRYLRRAVELVSADALHRSRYEEVLDGMGRHREACAQVDTALALPVRTPLDSVAHARARRVLRRIPELDGGER